ncbi:MAG: acetate--CoA ligase family protein, partial [Gammaproteobacteria bacterium]|nr:acetate--CoA ligase family protein [Gammaproteobacteria bacterium]
WVVNPNYDEIEGYRCYARLEDLPEAPDLAFIAIRREAAVEAIEVLKQLGCGAFVCNAAGFAETGDEGDDLQRRLVVAAGDMPALGPNAVGLVNYVDPMAAMMDHFGVHQVEHGVAIISQGGGVLCDAVFCDRGLSITHMVGCGNQAVTGAESCVDYLLDDPRVRAVGLSFEGLHDVAGLRRAAARALSLGKPIVAMKFGKSEAGARASASHTASMTGRGEAWEALFRRLGIVSVASESEFFEALKLFDSGHIPKGRRVLVTAASGVMGVMLADHLSAAGFDLPQPDDDRKQKLRELLPGIATPCNPQDVTMAVWNHKERQRDIYATLLEQGYDIALMVQNYPRDGMWDISEYEAQVEALGEACAGCDVAALQLAPMVDCFPAHARNHTQSLGLAAMQGLEECIAAL